MSAPAAPKATTTRQMRLAASIYSGEASQAWRHPQARPDARLDLGTFVEYAELAEAACFDTLFLPDTGAPARLAPDVMQRLSSLSVFEPLTLMCALAMHTQRIGLVYTASATFNEPYHVARQVASLDHLSGGRAGWNLVTSLSRTQSANFGGGPQPAHDARYRKAEEFHDVVTGLWDSFDDDAFVRDKASGRFVDPRKMHYLEHSGEFFSVEGPLRIARPPQGHPVVAQAGASEAGRELGARTADLIFCTNLSLEDGQTFYADMKRRTVAHGRDPDDLKILTGTAIVWGETDAEARARFEQLSSLYPVDVAIHNLAIDLEGRNPDDKFPQDLPPSLGSQGHQKAITDFARRHDFTIRQTAQALAASAKHRVLIGSTTTIADDLEAWFRQGAADGFVVISPFFLDGFRDIARHVVPELQRRGLFRSAYEGHTLREHLGVPRPPSRYRRA
ncbi:LLM class flavin-dependent oxidoreductase [Xylophilus sp.]|uniref:LLM class flavin-dependent oxidoreductase n=1 Tax=Xylophilus sp. TaxID=2653893 RepID=UPI0013BC9F34|nr:LLM class flavin-dependent oxidoreductase [Xylophilus sp.]KAF1044483.1 MAG: Nitrilotriacetate monooxygenase component A [Xylophilus sp.]